MRVQLLFSSSNPLKLNLHYHSTVSGFLYQQLSDEKFQSFIHDEGFDHHGRTYKLFCFSRLSGKYQINTKNKEIIFESPFSFILSSPVDAFIHDVIRTLLQKDELFLSGQQIRLESANIMPNARFTEKVRIRMLSPMVNYSTLTHPNGLKYTYYYKPHDEQFAQMTEENLKRKYCSYHNDNEVVEQFPFHIRPIRVHTKDKTITKFRNTVIEGWMGEYELEGDSELLKWAYETGLGSKNSMGFGMFEVIEGSRALGK